MFLPLQHNVGSADVVILVSTKWCQLPGIKWNFRRYNFCSGFRHALDKLISFDENYWLFYC